MFLGSREQVREVFGELEAELVARINKVVEQAQARSASTEHDARQGTRRAKVAWRR